MWLRIPVVLAFLFWFSLIPLSLIADLQLPVHVWIGIILFSLMFLTIALYYWFMRITVDEYAVTYRGVWSFRSYAFDDILEIRVQPVPGMTNYDVRTRWDGLCFTSLISHHRDLVGLIARRAKLRNPFRAHL